MQAHPDITGWGFLGGWPLFTDHALQWPAGTIKCVSVDALPPELDYVRSGHVQVTPFPGRLWLRLQGRGAVLVEKLHLKRTRQR